MSDTNAPEPTMEEILASIRRIISEDDAPPTADPAAASPGDPPQPAMEAAEPETHDDVLELTDRVEPAPALAPAPAPAPAPTPALAAAPPPAPASVPPPRPAPAALGDLDFASDPPPSPRPQPQPARVSAAPPTSASDAPLISHQAADRASDMFGALTSSLAMPASGRTLEDVVHELLRPMLKDWLDQNLPAIVEQRVQDEVERISRRRTY